MDSSSSSSSSSPAIGHGSRSPYTFGDSDLAARRLALLARIYEHPTRAFLRRCAGASFQCPGSVPPATLALDLGCGPGYSTRLIHQAVAPTRTVGIDSSPAHVERARAAAGSSQGATDQGPREVSPVSYLQHDVRVAPFPFADRADLVFARFILTHLPEPGPVLRAWTDLLTDGGVMLLQETTRLECPHPAFIRYYQLVGELQRLHGQSLYIGRQLEPLVRSAGLAIFHAEEARFERTAADMAQVHLMNLRSWREDETARRAFDPRELDQLAATLQHIASGAERCPPVLLGLGEVAARRPPPGP